MYGLFYLYNFPHGSLNYSLPCYGFIYYETKEGVLYVFCHAEVNSVTDLLVPDALKIKTSKCARPLDRMQE